MVCAKCLKHLKSTTLATPAVKKKTELYYGSTATSTGKTSATVGVNGVSKVSLEYHNFCIAHVC